MLDCHPLGGSLPDRPWCTTGYGLGLMMGTLQRPGLAQPVEVVGHSAGGPGSVGAVYRRVGPADQVATAACFRAGTDEGVAEDEVLARLIAVAASGPLKGRSIKSAEQDQRE